MKSEPEVRKEIKRIEGEFGKQLSRGNATIFVNAPLALTQVAVISMLEALYSVLNERRPLYGYDTQPQDT